jgi:hypothetical protein
MDEAPRIQEGAAAASAATSPAAKPRHCVALGCRCGYRGHVRRGIPQPESLVGLPYPHGGAIVARAAPLVFGWNDETYWPAWVRSIP